MIDNQSSEQAFYFVENVKLIDGSIENGDWLLIPSDYDLIFNTPSSDILEKLKSLIDIDIDHFSGGLSGLS